MYEFFDWEAIVALAIWLTPIYGLFLLYKSEK